MEINVRFCTDLKTIIPQENGDWYDLAIAEDVFIEEGSYREISLGVAIELPNGYEAYVIPRSSTFKKYGLIQTNSIGLIDNSYCGNNDIWKFPCIATKNVSIEKGTRLCQFRIQRKMDKVTFKSVEDLGNKDRNGFGSTGN